MYLVQMYLADAPSRRHLTCFADKPAKAGIKLRDSRPFASGGHAHRDFR